MPPSSRRATKPDEAVSAAPLPPLAEDEATAPTPPSATKHPGRHLIESTVSRTQTRRVGQVFVAITPRRTEYWEDERRGISCSPPAAVATAAPAAAKVDASFAVELAAVFPNLPESLDLSCFLPPPIDAAPAPRPPVTPRPVVPVEPRRTEPLNADPRLGLLLFDADVPLVNPFPPPPPSTTVERVAEFNVDFKELVVVVVDAEDKEAKDAARDCAPRATEAGSGEVPEGVGDTTAEAGADEEVGEYNDDGAFTDRDALDPGVLGASPSIVDLLEEGAVTLLLVAGFAAIVALGSGGARNSSSVRRNRSTETLF